MTLAFSMLFGSNVMAVTPRYTPISSQSWYKSYQSALKQAQDVKVETPKASIPKVDLSGVDWSKVKLPTTTNTTKETQVKTYDKIVDNCLEAITSYDAQNSSLSSALISKKGNCCTFAEYVKIACDIKGIECQIIYGTNDTNSYNVHIWNRVKLDNVWYWSDLTSCMYTNSTKYAHVTSDLQSFASYKNYVYVLETDGTYKQLSACTLSAQADTVKNTCSGAKQTASVVKSEYSKCYETIKKGCD